MTHLYPVSGSDTLCLLSCIIIQYHMSHISLVHVYYKVIYDTGIIWQMCSFINRYCMCRDYLHKDYILSLPMFFIILRVCVRTCNCSSTSCNNILSRRQSGRGWREIVRENEIANGLLLIDLHIQVVHRDHCQIFFAYRENISKIISFTNYT